MFRTNPCRTDTVSYYDDLKQLQRLRIPSLPPPYCGGGPCEKFGDARRTNLLGVVRALFDP